MTVKTVSVEKGIYLIPCRASCVVLIVGERNRRSPLWLTDSDWEPKRSKSVFVDRRQDWSWDPEIPLSTPVTFLDFVQDMNTVMLFIKLLPSKWALQMPDICKNDGSCLRFRKAETRNWNRSPECYVLDFNVNKAFKCPTDQPSRISFNV